MLKNIILTVLRGSAMGCADAVPGVSGGTIALILGFYDRFIQSLHHCLSWCTKPLNPEKRQNFLRALSFLIPLGVGLVSTLYLATKILVGKGVDKNAITELNNDNTAIQDYLAANPPQGLLQHPETAPIIYALFFGLVLGSIPAVWKMKKSLVPNSDEPEIKRKFALDIGLLIFGCIAAVALSIGNPIEGSTESWAIVLSGSIALSVMILPGVSGTLALLMIGMYQPISQALHQRDFPVLGLFIFGMLLSAALVVPVLRWSMKRWHDRIMSLLCGLMLGSLAALWPWKTHYLPKLSYALGPIELLPPQQTVIACVIAIIVGIGLAILLNVLGKRSLNNESASHTAADAKQTKAVQSE